MNTFYEHHKDSIRFGYRCFDRILLNGLIQPFQQPERVVGFFGTYRNQYPVSRDVLRDIAQQFQNWVKNRSQKWNVPILEAPEGRRDEFVEPYFRHAQPDQVVLILKAREPARILIAIGKKQDNRWHLQLAQRWIVQYNFYLNDRHWGRMFVRMSPYFPFSARLCLNQHHWLARRMQEEGIDFQQTTNAFLRCRDPHRLQDLADSLSPHDLLICGRKWLNSFTPFFTEGERKHAGCQHRLFFAQVEFCDNLIFHRRVALDQLGERLLDANRTLGQPNKITVIFGRKISRRYHGKLQTVLEHIDLPNPVIRSHYGHGFIKQYVRDHLLLRTESATNNVTDYAVKKSIDHLPQLQQKLSSIADNDLSVQQDILETFVDRGQLRQLSQPTFLPNGRRIPGLKLDHPRQLALMHALLRFSHIAAGNTFTTVELHPQTAEALACSIDDYRLSSLRYDLSKLRAKGLVEKIPRSRRYRLLPDGYRICLVFLKLFERIYAPLTAGLLRPFPADHKLQQQHLSQLDRLYQRVTSALDDLVQAVGLKAA
jgi:DNA-binding transcriptional ArsR family regulator